MSRQLPRGRHVVIICCLQLAAESDEHQDTLRKAILKYEKVGRASTVLLNLVTLCRCGQENGVLPVSSQLESYAKGAFNFMQCSTAMMTVAHACLHF